MALSCIKLYRTCNRRMERMECERKREKEINACKYPAPVFNVGGDNEIACVIC